MAARKQECGLKEKAELDRFKTLLFAGLWYTGYVALVILIYVGVYVLVYRAFATLLPVELYRNVMLFTVGMPVAKYLGLKGSLLKTVLMSFMTAVPDGSSENEHDTGQ